MQNPSRQEELQYLENTLAFIKKDLNKLMQEALAHRKDLVEARRDMVENTTPFSNDFDRLTEMVQFLSEVSSQTVSYTNIAQYVTRYKKLIDSPYFARFDFVEDGFGIREKIYIGLANIMDRKTHDVYVYDWRAPISSIFYRYEKGRASYETPVGTSSGEVKLKRQYKIKNSILQYFFDCDIRITDEVLQEILGRNSSPKMKSIVETIQKEQDIIIRDTENELLMVQGTAGSGKTSIAMHRIAFLLYEGQKYRSNNILIISPNDVFSQYISSVLPELGEENVQQVTFDDLVAQSFKEGLNSKRKKITWKN
jgi:DNA helicase-2/ATP-dependent DNA helicase PcrA